MKGQVSLELILAVIVAIIAGSAFSLVGTEIMEVQREASVRHQLDGIGTSLASAISKIGLLEDSDTARVTIGIPMIGVVETGSLQSCTIAIGGGFNGNELDLSYAPEGITVHKKFVPPPGGTMTIPAQAVCGGTLTITKP